jgi:hypothetical protein
VAAVLAIGAVLVVAELACLAGDASDWDRQPHSTVWLGILSPV